MDYSILSPDNVSSVRFESCSTGSMVQIRKKFIENQNWLVEFLNNIHVPSVDWNPIMETNADDKHKNEYHIITINIGTTVAFPSQR